MKVEFTKEQQAVIDARKCNILVSAAAGSGKTAVLVERIIKMIENDIDIDHLLVVTFTKAAAAQMKEKITLAIQERLLEDPDNKHLQKQETLIHNAQITTIDSFCQYVLRNNFNNIGVEPNLRVGDEGELALLKDDVMQKLLENEYALAKEGGNDDFLFCMDYFGSGSSDKKVEEYINQLYDFSMSMPWPEDWLNERATDYAVEGADFDELPWVKECIATTKRRINEMAVKLSAAEKICCEPDGPYVYGDTIEKDIENFEALQKLSAYDEFFDRIRLVNFDTLSRKSDPSINPEKRENVKNLRNAVKDDIKKLSENYFALPSGTVLEQMKLCDKAVKELCRLTISYKQLFDAAKRDKQMIDFSDMEHFALQILVEHPDEETCKGLSVMEILDKCRPSAVAMEYREFYKEVLIDEYQDSNNVQELILKSISGEFPEVSERFMVGDVKQSIYKFRLARPEIFMEKLVSYDKSEGAANRRIDLHKNFRSRKEVLEATNYIFEKIMGKDLGNVEYDQDARLVTGASYDEPQMDVAPELIMFDAESDSCEALSDYSSKEKEALVIAKRIHEIMAENSSLKYKDIVILLRSLSGWDDVFKRVLAEQGIPAYIESKSGYFDTMEVSVILNLLSVVDNPSQDIPLVSVMHSRIGNFTDEELAKLRIAIKEEEIYTLTDSFFYGLMELQKSSNEAQTVASLGKELMDKVVSFTGFINDLRRMSVFTPVHEILQYIMEKTGFDSYLLAMPGGDQRKANLDRLLSRALAFEKSSFKGIFHFVRYIENSKVVKVDYGEADIIDENADVVRIMSIHKSKGLEFPVVFVSGLTKGFNKMDITGDLITDMDMGIGVRCMDFQARVKYDTLKRKITADAMMADNLGEELRVLYVALTRAKEKLIMTASVKNPDKEFASVMGKLPELADCKMLPYSMRLGAGNYFDYVFPALIRHPGFEAVVNARGLNADLFNAYKDDSENLPAFRFSFATDEDIVAAMLKRDVQGIMKNQELKDALMGSGAAAGEFVDAGLVERLNRKFNSRYAYEQLKGLYTKTTVTELKKHMLEEKGEVFGHKADYAEDAFADVADGGGAAPGLSGAERGTAYHRIMEILDEKIYGNQEFMAEPTLDKIAAWIDEKAAKKVIPREYKEAVNPADIEVFLRTDLGRRMGEAFRNGLLMREKPFMMGLSANELKESFPEEEMILIQGIIDAWFIEGDEIVLLDYKTDHVKKESELVDRYKIQLDYYKRALEAATNRKVKEVLIYSFGLGCVVPLSVSV